MDALGRAHICKILDTKSVSTATSLLAKTSRGYLQSPLRRRLLADTPGFTVGSRRLAGLSLFIEQQSIVLGAVQTEQKDGLSYS